MSNFAGLGLYSNDNNYLTNKPFNYLTNSVIGIKAGFSTKPWSEKIIKRVLGEIFRSRKRRSISLSDDFLITLTRRMGNCKPFSLSFHAMSKTPRPELDVFIAQDLKIYVNFLRHSV